MAEPTTPLTDAQIKELMNLQIQHFLALGIEVAALSIALRKKGLLTESDIAEALKQAETESTPIFDRIAAAIRKGPVGGIQ
jgi:hypothetical protein